ncbi:type I methionyl aminopeptidase [Candidatus Uhrbacteria bacterium CG11_big_fil_rev_8_21_14_0_20_41_9]|nr:MAG: type I methionyl aminopeptidase [Candidatus Uhrbacteria bacterium CG11_big_fil_rev_8_21_14_0_20_41_9]
MALIKTDDEIAKMREGGALLSKALQSAVDMAKPGVTMRELDAEAERVIRAGGGVPSFKGYGGADPFPSTLCISKNDEIVHGIGERDIVLEEGDIVGLDIGLWLHNLATDMAVTVPIGNISKERKALLRTTRDSLYAGLEVIKPGAFISDIGTAVESAVDTKKYGIIEALVGHGVGHAVHEDPHIPNYKTKQFPKVKIKKGMCLAIEPTVTTGSKEIATDEDGWTIVTEDGSDASHFEVTVAVTEAGYEILTPLPEVKI